MYSSDALFPHRNNPTANNTSSRIHILGMGSVGKFIAHSLAGSYSTPPISLCYHRPSLFRGLRDKNCNLTVSNNNKPEERGPFDVELVLDALPSSWKVPEAGRHRVPPYEYYAPLMSSEPITHLILATKAHQTVSALASIMHRLSPQSTICFVQNGMGIVEEVNKHLYPDPATRPQYIIGVSSHGTHSQGPFAATHAGNGIIYLSIVPREHHDLPRSSDSSPSTDDSTGLFEPETDDDTHNTTSSTSAIPGNTSGWIDPSARYLLQTLARIPVLNVVPTDPRELHAIQLEKLAVNCVINPLTVMLDGRNGSILNNFAISRSTRLLLSEISLVYQSLPELKNTPDIDTKYSPARLESLVTSIARNTADNISSMLQDTRRGARTEIDYMNGYIVRRGEETGMTPAMNYLMMQMVKGKQTMISREVNSYVPVAGFESRADFEGKQPRPR
ncbi:MAG: hypothetical protein M1828_001992 [Chrysothrix sp. TS-e1954]|nr:MAG: hypothetical protein M1828_001992 [Chrysothrix sp. TS-e1954]